MAYGYGFADKDREVCGTAQREDTDMGSERIETLRGRYAESLSESGRVVQIEKAWLDERNCVKFQYSFAGKERVCGYLSNYRLKCPDWRPPEPEPERKATDKWTVFAEDLKNAYWNASGTMPDRAAMLAVAELANARLGATVDIKVGVKVVAKRAGYDGYISSITGPPDISTARKGCAYAPFKWTRPPDSQCDCALFDTRENARRWIGIHGSGYLAKSIYIPGNKPFENAPVGTVFASAVMLIEEPVPVAKAQEKSDTGGTTSFDEDGYWPPTRPKPPADEVREFPDYAVEETAKLLDRIAALKANAGGSWNTTRAETYKDEMRQDAVGFLRKIGFRPHSPLRVCTVSDDELGAKLMVLYGDSEVDEGFAAVGHRAKQLLLGDDAVNVDFVVYEQYPLYVIRALNDTAEKKLKKEHLVPDERTTARLFREGYTILLAENWKGSADVR